MIALACALVFLSLLHAPALATPAGGREEHGTYWRMRGELGHRSSGVLAPFFVKPYRRDLLVTMLAKCAAPEIEPRLRRDYMDLLLSVMKFQGVPEVDLREAVVLELTNLADRLSAAEGQAEGGHPLLPMAERSLWNARYALAFAVLRRAQESREPEPVEAAVAVLQKIDATGMGRYNFDLMHWYLQERPDTSLEKLLALAEVWRSRTPSQAIEQARAAKELFGTAADRKPAHLIALAEDDGSSNRLREWAVRELAEHPGDETAEFLQRIIREAADREKYPGAIPFEAQEALKRLGLLDQNYNKFIIVP